MSSPACTICDTPLPRFASAGPPLCATLACRWKYQALAPHQLCRICGRRLSAADLSAEACRDRDCWSTLGAQRARARSDALKVQVEAFRERVELHQPNLRGRSLTVIQIPGFESKTVRVPQRRKARLRRQLNWVLKGDQQPPSNVPAAVELDASMEPAIAQACGSCRGNCCQNGAEHAYLTRAKLEQVGAAHPGFSSEEIIDLYLSHVATRHYADSCIYHTRRGCSLPRELRSETCNNYFCEPMHEFLGRAAEDPETPLLLASVRRYVIRGGVVVDQDTAATVLP